MDVFHTISERAQSVIKNVLAITTFAEQTWHMIANLHATTMNSMRSFIYPKTLPAPARTAAPEMPPYTPPLVYTPPVVYTPDNPIEGHYMTGTASMRVESPPIVIIRQNPPTRSSQYSVYAFTVLHVVLALIASYIMYRFLSFIFAKIFWHKSDMHIVEDPKSDMDKLRAQFSDEDSKSDVDKLRAQLSKNANRHGNEIILRDHEINIRNTEIDQLKKDLAQIQQRIQQLETENQSQKDKYSAVERLHANAQELAQGLRMNFSSSKYETEEAKEKNYVHEDKIRKLTRDLKTSTSNETELQAENDRFFTETTALNRKLALKSKQMTTDRNTISGLKEQLATEQRTKNGMATEMAEMADMTKHLEDKYDATSKLNSIKDTQIDGLKWQLKSFKDDLDKTKKQLKVPDVSAQDLQKDLDKKRKQYQTLSDKFDTLQHDSIATKTKLTNTESILAKSKVNLTEAIAKNKEQTRAHDSLQRDYDRKRKQATESNKQTIAQISEIVKLRQVIIKHEREISRLNKQCRCNSLQVTGPPTTGTPTSGCETEQEHLDRESARLQAEHEQELARIRSEQEAILADITAAKDAEIANLRSLHDTNHETARQNLIQQLNADKESEIASLKEHAVAYHEAELRRVSVEAEQRRQETVKLQQQAHIERVDELTRNHAAELQSAQIAAAEDPNAELAEQQQLPPPSRDEEDLVDAPLTYDYVGTAPDGGYFQNWAADSHADDDESCFETLEEATVALAAASADTALDNEDRMVIYSPAPEVESSSDASVHDDNSMVISSEEPAEDDALADMADVMPEDDDSDDEPVADPATLDENGMDHHGDMELGEEEEASAIPSPAYSNAGASAAYTQVATPSPVQIPGLGMLGPQQATTGTFSPLSSSTFGPSLGANLPQWRPTTPTPPPAQRQTWNLAGAAPSATPTSTATPSLRVTRPPPPTVAGITAPPVRASPLRQSWTPEQATPAADKIPAIRPSGAADFTALAVTQNAADTVGSRVGIAQVLQSLGLPGYLPPGATPTPSPRAAPSPAPPSAPRAATPSTRTQTRATSSSDIDPNLGGLSERQKAAMNEAYQAMGVETDEPAAEAAPADVDEGYDDTPSAPAPAPAPQTPERALPANPYDYVAQTAEGSRSANAFGLQRIPDEWQGTTRQYDTEEAQPATEEVMAARAEKARASGKKHAIAPLKKKTAPQNDDDIELQGEREKREKDIAFPSTQKRFKSSKLAKQSSKNVKSTKKRLKTCKKKKFQKLQNNLQKTTKISALRAPKKKLQNSQNNLQKTSKPSALRHPKKRQNPSAVQAPKKRFKTVKTIAKKRQNLSSSAPKKSSKGVNNLQKTSKTLSSLSIQKKLQKV
ncbi:hypothetical protein BDV97DRAFT_347640 [Delphinella strobiligena]|nr:hypothetical protein BDV97DRAFT_347640 [Delphinella strobiligena]